MRFAPQVALTALLAASCVSTSTLVSRQSSTGDAKCFGVMCVTATVTGSEVQYVLSGTGQRAVGWMGIGWGSEMSGTDMVIVWPNSDGTFTLSQRTGTGHDMPEVDSSPARVATIQQSASDVTASQPTFAFTLPVGTIGTENIIWAFGTTNPGSSSPSASFEQHWDMGQSTLDLSRSLTTGTTPTPTPTSGDASGGSLNPLSSHDRMIIAHAVLCTVGFLFILPLGALVARYFRTSTSAWFKAHQAIQSLLAGPIIIVGFALGVAVIAQGGDPHFNDIHTQLGLALFILYVVQVVIGNVIHRYKPKSAARRRPAQNYFHVFLGILIIGLSFYQVRTGYKDEWPNSTGQDPLPRAADIVFYVWVSVIPLLYFAGFVFLPKQFRLESAARMPKEVSHEMGNNYRNS